MKKWLLIFVIFIAGCSNNEVQQDSLFLLPETSATAIANNSLPLLVVSTELDSYLAQANLVYRVSDTKVILANHNSWAHQISKQIDQRMASNLRATQKHYWPIAGHSSMQLTNQTVLKIHLNKFNGAFTGEAELSGEWLLINPQGKLIKGGQFDINTPLEADGYEQLVTSLAKGLVELSNDISKQINTL